MSDTGPMVLWSDFFYFVNLVSFFTWNAIKVNGQWASCGCNSSYSFAPIVLKLCRCFLHGMKMSCYLGIILWLFFLTFFFFVNLVSFFFFFLHEMVSKCIDSRYLVGTTPVTVFLQLFWNFADAFCMEWRCACYLGIILWLFFLTFSALWT